VTFSQRLLQVTKVGHFLYARKHTECQNDAFALSVSAKSAKNPGTQGLSVRLSGPILFGVCAGAAAVSGEMSEINSRAKGSKRERADVSSAHGYKMIWYSEPSPLGCIVAIGAAKRPEIMFYSQERAARAERDAHAEFRLRLHTLVPAILPCGARERDAFLLFALLLGRIKLTTDGDSK
jgi:hypothetical protein